MDDKTRGSLIAAAIILVGFGLLAFYLPTIMLWAGALSPFAAGAVAILFVAGFFLIFWFRARSQRRD